MRTAHPCATIETGLISHDGQMAIFRASVSIPGGGSATGWGSEQYNDFRDYIEKGETKALGRALAALGLGTQFTDDLALRESNDRGESAPAPRQPARQQAPPHPPVRSSGSHVATNTPPYSHNPDPADPVATWTRNLRNAGTPRALEAVIKALGEHGLRDHPRIAPVIEERRGELANRY